MYYYVFAFSVMCSC